MWWKALKNSLELHFLYLKLLSVSLNNRTKILPGENYKSHSKLTKLSIVGTMNWQANKYLVNTLNIQYHIHFVTYPEIKENKYKYGIIDDTIDSNESIKHTCLLSAV